MKTLKTAKSRALHSGTHRGCRTKWFSLPGVLSIAVLTLTTGNDLRDANAAQGYEIVAWGGMSSPNGELRQLTAIATGSEHSLALKADGSIIGWGWDGEGQATPPAGNDYVALAAGGAHSLALKSDGSIVGWGNNEYGQTSPPSGNDFVAITADGNYSVALKSDGSIVAWGNSLNGAAPPDGNDFIAISATLYQSLALRSDGSIVAWGEESSNQATPPAGNDFVAIDAGGGNASVALKSDGSIVAWGQYYNAKATPPAGNDFVAIAAGGNHSLALRSDGSIAAWGRNNDGEATPPSGNDFVAIAAGWGHSLALKSDGSIVGWGRNDWGQAKPVTGSDFVAISANGQFDSKNGLGLKTDGSIVFWGSNLDGEATPPSGNDFVAIAAGWNHGLALKSDGSIAAWGPNYAGEATPPSGNDFVAISAGSGFSLALKTDGSIMGWGGNELGQATPLSGDDFIAISAGNCHGLALKTDGSIVGWGSNEDGRASPPSGNDFVAIAAGSEYSLALKSDGSIVAWGYGTSRPVGNDFIAISAGRYHRMALKSDGSIITWGAADGGQVDSPAGKDFVAISAGPGYSLALKGERPTPVLEILQPPQSLTVAPGSTATFTVVTGGIESESFQWKRGDMNIGEDSPTLTTSNAQAGDAGAYSVTVTLGEDSITSRSVTLGVKAPPYDTETMQNISTRGQILEGSKIMIAGFVLQGSGQKDVLIRGIGPTLGSFGVAGVCTDPKLELFRASNPGTPPIAANEAWGDLSGNPREAWTRVGAFDLDDGSRDAVLVMNLAQGAYTAQVSGMDGTGVGLVELYDADLDPAASTCTLANISTRGEVGSSDQILIAGFVVDGEVPKQVLVRGIGPRLADFQVEGALVDPYLRIVKNATPDPLWVASNDDWSDNPNATDIVTASAVIGAFDLTDGSKDAVVLTWLEPGVYTAQLSGAGDTTGVALVEVYEAK